MQDIVWAWASLQQCTTEPVEPVNQMGLSQTGKLYHIYSETHMHNHDPELWVALYSPGQRKAKLLSCLKQWWLSWHQFKTCEWVCLWSFVIKWDVLNRDQMNILINIFFLNAPLFRGWRVVSAPCSRVPTNQFGLHPFHVHCLPIWGPNDSPVMIKNDQQRCRLKHMFGHNCKHVTGDFESGGNRSMRCFSSVFRYDKKVNLRGQHT